MSHDPGGENRDTRRRVVVIGAGFAGLQVARGLRNASVETTIIDRQNHHLFQPLLYQVATAGLAAPEISEPIRRALRRVKNARVIYGEVTRIAPATKTVWMGDEPVPYDTLVVATGVTHSYFGNADWAQYAPGLKTLADAQEIRSRILRAFEVAERAEGDEARAPWLRFVVVGGGPTGVELAGAIAELARRVLPCDYRAFDTRTAEILLLEAGDGVLNSYVDELSESARRQLENLGVTVKTGARVTAIDDDGVAIHGAGRIEAKTVIWAAGVQASPILASLGAPQDHAGRVEVTDHLHVPGDEDIFVVGDAAALERNGAMVPGIAPAAIQMGQFVASVIRARDDEREIPRFEYRDRGAMATIGRAAAVAEIGNLRLRGGLAWVAWLFVHLVFLIGFRSRVVVLINWLWAYVAYRPAAGILADLATSDLMSEERAGRQKRSQEEGEETAASG